MCSPCTAKPSCMEGRWIKATPAFKLSLCELFNVPPLEFDGCSDSVFRPFNQKGERYVEYLADHSQFDDLPQALFFGHLQRCYPHLFVEGGAVHGGDLQAEIASIKKIDN